MGQPGIDLPDPLGKSTARDRSSSAAVSPPVNADDLLAQLAGEEVDRLLSDVKGGAGEAGGDELKLDRLLNVDRRARRDSSTEKAARKAPVQAARASEAAAAMTALGTPPEVAIDDLFKQMGPGEAAAASGRLETDDIASEIEAELAAELEDQTGVGRGQALEESLTARAQQLIDQARWEAVDDYVIEGSPEAESNRASFAAAAGVETPPKHVEVISHAPAPAPATAGGETAEPPSAAAALAQEMDDDERHHADTLTRLAAAKDREEAAKHVGTGGLDVTGVAIVGEVEITADSSPRPQARPPSQFQPAQAIGVAASEEQIVIGDGVELEIAVADAVADLDEGRGPLLVRVLEWLNAPFADLSDRAREAMGKVAIATMVNAVGVLAYVLIFRR